MRRIPNSNFELKKTEPWIKRSPFESNLYHSISLLLPVYEHALIEYVCASGLPPKGKVYDEAVLLLKHERSHGKVYSKYNKILEDSGYRFGIITALAKANASIVGKLASKSIKLEICAAAEHLTAMVAVYFKEEYQRYREGSNEVVRELWHWHAIEELEHSAAAFDLASYHKYSYSGRILALFLVSAWLILPMVTLGTLLLSMQDRSIFTLRFWKNAGYTLFRKGGLFSKFFSESLLFLRPKFDPVRPDYQEHISYYDQMEKEKLLQNSKSA